MDFKKTKFGRYMNSRVPANKRYQPTEYEHAANCATHAFWILPSMVGGSVLYFLSVNKWHRVAALVYGSGLTGLFLTSTLFHTAAWKISHLRKVEERFHMCDRMAIYFFIAASYFPWYKLGEMLGYLIMGAVPALVVLSMVDRSGVCELILGGVFYVVGVVFFKSDGLVPFAHAIWHLFVAVGASIHYYAIWRYLYVVGPQLQTSR
ncbi:monocyte to macrophage differentiation factor 2a isoform 2-T2 [Anableps anableps]